MDPVPELNSRFGFSNQKIKMADGGNFVKTII